MPKTNKDTKVEKTTPEVAVESQKPAKEEKEKSKKIFEIYCKAHTPHKFIRQYDNKDDADLFVNNQIKKGKLNFYIK